MSVCVSVHGHHNAFGRFKKLAQTQQLQLQQQQHGLD